MSHNFVYSPYDTCYHSYTVNTNAYKSYNNRKYINTVNNKRNKCCISDDPFRSSEIIYYTDGKCDSFVWRELPYHYK